MSTIRTVYRDAPPNFPASDQHPDAVRYGPIAVDGQIYFVDALNGAPTVDQIRALIAPPAVELTLDQKLANAGLTREDILTIMNEGA